MTLGEEKTVPLNNFLDEVVKKNLSKSSYFHLFIGAGCSISSNLPSGWGVIELLKILSYNNSNNIVKDSHFLEVKAKLEQKFKEDPNELVKFNNFVKNSEKQNKKKISENKTKYLTTLIDNVNLDKIELAWAKYEQYFYDCSLYSHWFEKYSLDPKIRQSFIEEIIDQSSPNSGYLILSHLIKNKLFKTIFTTNFDDLINECLIKYTNIKARIYAHNEIARFIDYNSIKPNIIKLHGDYLFENIKNTLRETSQLEKLFSQKFISGLKTNGLIVLGYSGNDISIMKDLYQIKLNSKQTKIYWCDISETNLSLRTKKFILENENVFFVQIPFFDELMCLLWGKSRTEISLSRTNKTINNSFQNDLIQKSIVKAISNKAIPTTDIDFLLSQSKELNLIETLSLTLDPYERVDLISKKLSFKEFKMGYLLRGISYFDIAIKYNSIKDIENAKSDLDTFIELSKISYHAYYYRGCCNYKLKKWKSAIDDFSKAIEINSNSYLAYNNRGLAKMRLQKYEEAHLDFLIAVNQKKDADFYNNIGVNFRNWGKYKEGLQFINEGIKIDPSFSFLYGTKAELYAGLNNELEFYNNMEKALSLGYPIKEFLLEIDTIQKFKEQKKFNLLIKKYEKNWIR